MERSEMQREISRTYASSLSQRDDYTAEFQEISLYVRNDEYYWAFKHINPETNYQENKTTPITMKKKEKSWFPHEEGFYTTPEMSALLNKHGGIGYSSWFILLEILRAEDGYKLDITKPFIHDMLATAMRITEEKLKELLKDYIEVFGIVQTNGTYIWSDHLKNRMGYMEKRKKALSEAGKKGGKISRPAKKTEAIEKPCLNESNQGLSQEEAMLKPTEAHNNTIHNNTLQNTTASTTKQETKNEAVAVNPSENKISNTVWDTHKTAALADKMKFVYPMVSSGRVTEQQLERWLSAFNRTLDFRGDLPKSYTDYRSHFNQWFKYRNTAVEDPDAITGVAAAVHTPLPAVANAMGYCKTPEQAQADLDRHREEWKKQREKEKQKRA